MMIFHGQKQDLLVLKDEESYTIFFSVKEVDVSVRERKRKERTKRKRTINQSRWRAEAQKRLRKWGKKRYTLIQWRFTQRGFCGNFLPLFLCHSYWFFFLSHNWEMSSIHKLPVAYDDAGKQNPTVRGWNIDLSAMNVMQSSERHHERVTKFN